MRGVYHMSKIQRVSLIGLGGVGGTYASKLYDMDPKCLKVITDKERYDRYSRKGFIINGKKYQFDYIRPEEKVEPSDLVIVSVKYHHINQAIKDIKNHVGPNTIILSLLNGISSEKIIGQEYGIDKVLYGMVIGVDAIREDNKISFADTAKLYFGEETNNTYSPKVLAVKELFDRANIQYVIPENMVHTLWWKFMFNVGINQTSAVLKASYKVFHEIQEAEDFLRETMREVVKLSEKMGIGLSEENVQEFVDILRGLSPQGKTSMLQDIEAGRKTEVEMLAGEVCRLGEQLGVDTPINKMLLNMIRTMEKMTIK